MLVLGLDRGDRIGIWSLNRPQWTLTQFAAAKAGLILVTINPAYRLHELEFALTKVGCTALGTVSFFDGTWGRVGRVASRRCRQTQPNLRLQ